MAALHIYIDGVLQVVGSITGNMTNWDDNYDLILGNEASGDRPWLGKFFLVAVYCSAFTVDEVQQNRAAGLTPFNDPADTDGDNVLDVIDNCPLLPNASQIDSDGDNIGDVCDDDTEIQDSCFVVPTTDSALVTFCL